MPYSIRTKPRTNQGLKYIHLARTRGSEIAIDYMLEVLQTSDNAIKTVRIRPPAQTGR